MGQAKRRQELLGEDYGREVANRSSKWGTKTNRDKLIRWTVEGLLISAISLVVLLITFKF